MKAVRRLLRSPRFWLAGGLLLLAAALLVGGAGAVLLAGSRTRYRRFVSSPLPDGSRITFRYPAHLERVVESPGANEVSYSIAAYTPSQTPAQWELLLARLGLPVRARGESVSVVVLPKPKERPRARRWSARFARLGQVRHNEYLFDARAGIQYSLYHDAPREAAAQFERHSPTVAGSFQVLPPGAPVPSP